MTFHNQASILTMTDKYVTLKIAKADTIVQG